LGGASSAVYHPRMGRFRPPERPGSKYITPAGAARLRAELDELWRRERPQVTAAVSAAAAQGDRSENAEYIYGKRRLREIDRRVRFLRARLQGMTIVDRPPADRNRVYFGARVTLETESGAQHVYRIVGPDEIELGGEHISMDAPLGRALLGQRLDAEVAVSVGSETRRFVIVRIEYAAECAGTSSPPARS
jgi:transcription elongation factor GreB